MAPKKSSTTKKTTTTTHRQVETERRAEVAEQEQAAAERASDEITETPAEGQTAETRSRSRSRHPPETHNLTVNDIAIHYAMDSALEADAAMRYINPRLTLTLTLTLSRQTRNR